MPISRFVVILCRSRDLVGLKADLANWRDMGANWVRIQALVIRSEWTLFSFKRHI